MKIFGLLNKERVRARMEAGSKKKVLECLSGVLSASLTTHTTEQVFDQLIARERLGSTGLGSGVALPHCRLSGIDEPMGALANWQNYSCIRISATRYATPRLKTKSSI